MGIDYAASFADVIAWKDIEQIAPAAAAGWLTVLDAVRGELTRDAVLAALAESQNCDLLDDPVELQQCLLAVADDDRALELACQLVTTFEAFRAAFTAATTRAGAGLTLWLGYHDSANRGCRGDDLDGVYWSVDGAYILSPAGRAYEHVFERKFFTQWG